MVVNPVWPFTPQPNKPSYNEGNRIATSPVWSMVEGSNIPITPTHDPCGYWTKNYTVPLPPYVFDFAPTDLCTDGSYLYVCGAKTGSTICKIVKLDMEFFSLIDSVEYDYSASGIEEYSGIRYENGFIYLSGYGNYGSAFTGVAFIHKRPTTNLSVLTWEYNYSKAGLNCWFQEPEVDDNYVYATGIYDAYVVEALYGRELTVKVDKLTGAQVWLSNTILWLPVGINQSGNYLYIYKNIGNCLGIRKIDKSDSAIYTDYTYTKIGTFYRGVLDGTNIYVSGVTPLTGVQYTGLVMKIDMSTMTKTWEYDRDTSPTLYDDFERCVKDNLYIYAQGLTTGTPVYDMMLEKLDLDGNLILSKRIVGRRYATYCILEYGKYLYFADNYTIPIGIERRLKSTLEIG